MQCPLWWSLWCPFWSVWCPLWWSLWCPLGWSVLPLLTASVSLLWWQLGLGETLLGAWWVLIMVMVIVRVMVRARVRVMH